MWRVGLLLAACLGVATFVAISPAEAGRLSRGPCIDRDSGLCGAYRGAPEYWRHKFSHSRALRNGAKRQPVGIQPAKTGQAYSTATPPAIKPAAEPAAAKLLPTRFDPLASGGEGVENTAPFAPATPSPSVNPILIALAGGGILSLFLARAAEF